MIPMPPDSEETTEAILLRALHRDTRAWDTFFVRLWPVVAGTVTAVMGGSSHRHSVEDVIQNVFVLLLEKQARRLRRFDGNIAPVERYVARIARHCAIDYLRAQTRRRERTALDGIIELPQPQDPDPLPMIEGWELEAALATLSEPERRTITMLFQEHRTTADIAASLAISPDTVRSHKCHALKKLRRFFGY